MVGHSVARQPDLSALDLLDLVGHLYEAAASDSAHWDSFIGAIERIYPGGRITEAAGNNQGGCSMRVVSFTTSDNWQRVIQFYQGVAQRGGYDAEQQVRGGDHVLGGVNQRTDGAYYLIVTPQPNGSEVALIVNNGP